MNLFIYAVLGLAVTWALYVLYMNVATRAAEGRPADVLMPLFPELGAHLGRALVYCYSPQCGPCRAMSREVDALVANGAPIFKLNIAEHRGVARDLGIRATPTLILVEEGVIARMVLGVKNARFMTDLIDRPAT